MFNFFKKNEMKNAKKTAEIYSIVEGQMISIEDVPDNMFANRLLGDGVAFDFATDTIYAPCEGEVLMIAETKHAIGIKTVNNAEILIHIGMDTVNCGGEGFTLLVKEGQRVKPRQAIVKVDRQFFDKQGISLLTPMIVTTQEYQLEIEEACKVNLNSLVMKIL